MERTIFGIFALWLSKKQELDFSVGREISTDINGKELTILAKQYCVSDNVVKLAYSMWKVAKPTQKIIERICQKAMKLNNKERCEDTLFLLAVLILLALIGQWCQYYGYVIYLDF